MRPNCCLLAEVDSDRLRDQRDYFTAEYLKNKDSAWHMYHLKYLSYGSTVVKETAVKVDLLTICSKL